MLCTVIHLRQAILLSMDCITGGDTTNEGINAVNVGGLSLLHIATLSGELEMMEALLDKGADVDIQDKNGLTPLFYAICSFPAKLDAVKLLLSHRANPNVRDKKYERTPLHYAALSRAIIIANTLLKSITDTCRVV